MTVKSGERSEEPILAIFDGQAVEWDGMGRDVYQNFEAARDVFEEASDVIGINMARVCFGNLHYLQKDTRIGQPAIAAVSLAEYRAWQRETGQIPDVVTGLSLGLWTAAGVSGAFTDIESEKNAKTIELIAKRAEIIHRVAEKYPGAMGRIVGLAHDHVPELLKETATEVGVWTSRAKKRLAVTGSHKAIQAAKKFVEERGAKFEHLSVPFAAHSKHQEDTALPIQDLLLENGLYDPEIKLLSNHGQYLLTGKSVARHLVEQMTSTAEWSDTLERAALDGLSKVIGFGPDVKRGLQKQMVKEYKAVALEWSPSGQPV
jgi:[acyl-carrier-protein] S-malonyltransferase